MGAPAIEVTRRVIPEDGGHAFRTGNVTYGGSVPTHVLHSVSHGQLGVSLQDLGFCPPVVVA